MLLRIYLMHSERFQGQIYAELWYKVRVSPGGESPGISC